MYKIHCDECGKEINESKESYYSIEINRETPIRKTYTVRTLENNEDFEVAESWTTLKNIQFCNECWKKVGLKKYLER